MELLERGRFARRVSGSEWEVAWGPFQHEGDDVRRALAQRAESPPRDGNLGRLDRTRRARARAAQPQPTLWESLRSEEHTSELQSLMRISYAVFCLKKKKKTTTTEYQDHEY